MYEDKILNNSYDSVNYGADAYGNSQIAINPMVSDRYEETTTDDITSVYARRALEAEIGTMFAGSPFYAKYFVDPMRSDDPSRRTKKVERGDMADIYYYFKGRLMASGDYSLVDVFCAIAEFFDLNYRTLYNDVISLEDKAAILDILSDSYGLMQRFVKSKKLF